jgi:hypothetical protein
VMYTQPKEDETQITSYGRVAGDHGGPLWEPMTIYHNTLLHVEAPWRGYYLCGLGGHLAGGSKRRLFNNMVVQSSGQPGNVLPPVVSPQPAAKATSSPAVSKPADPLDALLDGDVKTAKSNPQTGSPATTSPELDKLSADLKKKSQPKVPLPVDFQTDGNLQWSYTEKPTAETLFARFRNSPEFEKSKALYRPGWTAGDMVADPELVSFSTDWNLAVDCRLRDGSPAVNSGVRVPDQWPDPLRRLDSGDPDIGAIPAGVPPWQVGVGGRLSVFGGNSVGAKLVAAPGTFLIGDKDLPRSPSFDTKPAVIVQGYPAFDAPLIEFALRRVRIPLESLQRTWLEPADYENYGLVVVVGDLPRAKIEPNKYNAHDLKHVSKFLNNGGTLMLMRGNTGLFNTEEGRAFLADQTGTNKAARDRFEILLPKHPWISHLDPKQTSAWTNEPYVQPIRTNSGELVIGSRTGLATLYRRQVGKGQLIYVGWDISRSLPHGRLPSTVEQEAVYEQQMQILSNIIDSIGKSTRP